MFHTDHNPLMTNSNFGNVSTDGEIAWSVSGFSNGQVIGGAVVTNTAANNDDFYWTQGNFIMAGTYPNNNAANGEKAVIKWRYRGVGLFGESTPAVSTDGKTLYVRGSNHDDGSDKRDGYVYAIDTKTGSLVWQWVDKQKSMGNSYGSVVLHYDSNTKTDTLYVFHNTWGENAENILYSLNSKSGEVNWSYSIVVKDPLQTTGCSRTSPAIFTSDTESSIVITTTDGYIRKVDRKTGAFIWEYQAMTDKYTASTTPIIDSIGNIYVASMGSSIATSENGLHAFLYYISIDGKLIWKIDLGMNKDKYVFDNVWSPVLNEKKNVLYIAANSYLFTFDITNKNQEPVLMWSYRVYDPVMGYQDILSTPLIHTPSSSNSRDMMYFTAFSWTLAFDITDVNKPFKDYGWVWASMSSKAYHSEQCQPALNKYGQILVGAYQTVDCIGILN